MLNYIYEHDNLKKKSQSPNDEKRITNYFLIYFDIQSSIFFVSLKLILSYKTENTIFEIG